MMTSVNNNVSTELRWLILVLSLGKPIAGIPLSTLDYFCTRLLLALNISLELRGNVREKKIKKSMKGNFNCAVISYVPP